MCGLMGGGGCTWAATWVVAVLGVKMCVLLGEL